MGIGPPSLYAAFGSKERLYAEALDRFAEAQAALLWAAFDAAKSVRKAVRALLLASAAAYPESPDHPAGCMLTLSAAGQEGHPRLGEIVALHRAEVRTRLERRLARAVADGELHARTDVATVAGFVLAVQAGMAVQARDGAGEAELERVARAAMAGWKKLVAR